MRAGWLIAATVAAGCAGGDGGGWAQPGADEAAARRAHQECRAVAARAVRTEADINQDIIASRQRDWQRSGISTMQRSTIQENTRDRAAAIVASCMRSKGFARAP